MAVSKEFKHPMQGVRGLKADKDYKKFIYRFKVQGREFTRTFDYSKKTWDKATRKREAIAAAIKFKDDKTKETVNPFDRDTTVDFVADAYFTKKCNGTKWDKERERLYELHIKSFIGRKRASQVIEYDIDLIRSEMKRVSHPKYSDNKVGAVARSFSDRTVEKVLFQVLKPILVYAKSNGAIERLPTIEAHSKTTKSERKKEVEDGTKKLALLHNAIMTRYADDAYYRALFLFALYGRRFNEIRTLEWSSVDLEEKTYTIKKEHNKIKKDQKYSLPLEIKDAITQINDNETGVIFKPHRGGETIHTPRKQLAKLKADTNIDELTMHYFRHILVTAMGEQGTSATIMSASLGHTNTETVDRSYRTINHRKASAKANEEMEHIIDAEVIDEN